MERNKIIVIALIVIIVALVIGLAVIMPDFGKEKSKISINSNATIDEGEPINIKLTDENNTPIKNETVNVTLTDDKGEVEHKVAVTNTKGVAKVKVDDEGNYTVNCTFQGNDNFTKNTTSKKIEVKEAKIATPSSVDDSPNDDPGAFYSAQAGRVIYTGEIQDAPDGHRYKHLGYNEWELVD